jgi:hypothetical protein
MMSFLTYITGFIMKFELLPILTDYAMVSVLKCGTQFWKRTNQDSFQQSLVEIGSIVSEEKYFSCYISKTTRDRC